MDTSFHASRAFGHDPILGLGFPHSWEMVKHWDGNFKWMGGWHWDGNYQWMGWFGDGNARHIFICIFAINVWLCVFYFKFHFSLWVLLLGQRSLQGRHFPPLESGISAVQVDVSTDFKSEVMPLQGRHFQPLGAVSISFFEWWDLKMAELNPKVEIDMI